jgi:transposase
MAEGQSTAEIAHLLKVSDRTVERYKKSIRQKNAILPSPELVNNIAGRLVDEAQICIQRIRKTGRDNNCPHAARIEGERGCFQIVNNLAERLQSMGYLPTSTQKLEAELNHHTANPLTLKEIRLEAKRLQKIKSSMSLTKNKNINDKTLKSKTENDD